MCLPAQLWSLVYTQGHMGHGVFVCVSVQGSEEASVRVRGQPLWGEQGKPAGAAGLAMPQQPGILLPLPLCCPACTLRCWGLWHPQVPSTGAASVSPQHLPPVCPGLEPAPAAGGRLTAPTPRAPALPQPGESGCFPVCLLPFALIPGTGDSGSQAAVPAGARSQPPPAHTPGVLPQGLSGAHIFLILFPQEGLEPCTQPCFAARSVPTLGAEGLGTRVGGGRGLGRCKSHRAAEPHS